MVERGLRRILLVAVKAKRRRAKGGVSKSQLVRDYMEAHPEKQPKEVADAITATGTPVKAQLVSTIKFNLARRGKGKRKGKPGRRPKLAKAGARTGSVAYESLVAAKEFAAQAGGIGAAKKVLDALGNLQ